MDRVLLSVGTGDSPEQRLRAEQLLRRILVCAPKGSYLVRDPDRISIALRGSARPRRNLVHLWDEARP
ncbi:MAG: hypothetical protein ACYCSS_14945 [Sulfuriferula sp.]